MAANATSAPAIDINAVLGQFKSCMEETAKRMEQSQQAISDNLSAKIDNQSAQLKEDIKEQTAAQISDALDPFASVLEDLKNKVVELDLKATHLGTQVAANTEAIARQQADQSKVSSDAEMDEEASQASAAT